MFCESENVTHLNGKRCIIFNGEHKHDPHPTESIKISSETTFITGEKLIAGLNNEWGKWKKIPWHLSEGNDTQRNESSTASCFRFHGIDRGIWSVWPWSCHDYADEFKCLTAMRLKTSSILTIKGSRDRFQGCRRHEANQTKFTAKATNQSNHSQQVNKSRVWLKLCNRFISGWKRAEKEFRAVDFFRVELIAAIPTKSR